MSKAPPPFTPTTTVTPNQEDGQTQIDTKKRERPRGVKMELLALQSGGIGGRPRSTMRYQSRDSDWTLSLSRRPAAGKKKNLKMNHPPQVMNLIRLRLLWIH